MGLFQVKSAEIWKRKCRTHVSNFISFWIGRLTYSHLSSSVTEIAPWGFSSPLLSWSKSLRRSSNDLMITCPPLQRLGESDIANEKGGSHACFPTKKYLDFLEKRFWGTPSVFLFLDTKRLGTKRFGAHFDSPYLSWNTRCEKKGEKSESKNNLQRPIFFLGNLSGRKFNCNKLLELEMGKVTPRDESNTGNNWIYSSLPAAEAISHIFPPQKKANDTPPPPFPKKKRE